MIRQLWLASSFALLAPSTAHAQRVCDPQDARVCSQPVRQGEPAPFAGQLLTPEMAIRLGQKADGCDARIEAEKDLAKKLCDLDVGLEKKMRAVETEACDASKARLAQALKEADKVPFYEHPLFVVLVTVTAYTLAVWGAGQLRP